MVIAVDGGFHRPSVAQSEHRGPVPAAQKGISLVPGPGFLLAYPDQEGGHRRNHGRVRYPFRPKGTKACGTGIHPPLKGFFHAFGRSPPVILKVLGAEVNQRAALDILPPQQSNGAQQVIAVIGGFAVRDGLEARELFDRLFPQAVHVDPETVHTGREQVVCGKRNPHAVHFLEDDAHSGQPFTILGADGRKFDDGHFELLKAAEDAFPGFFLLTIHVCVALGRRPFSVCVKPVIPFGPIAQHGKGDNQITKLRFEAAVVALSLVGAPTENSLFPIAGEGPLQIQVETVGVFGSP